MLHHFTQSIAQISLPEKFTFPFNYTPHPLCVLAAEELQTYLQTKPEWDEELQEGKMFGVLVVKHESQIGFLAAFSGNLAGKNQHEYFVPPVFDMLKKNDFFKLGEKDISDINLKIKSLEQNTAYLQLQKQLLELSTQASTEIEHAKNNIKSNKQARETRRAENPSAEEIAQMQRASQHEKAELKRLEKTYKEQLDLLQKKLDVFSCLIEQLKSERKSKSATLQMQIFDQFQMLNAKGETKGLVEIFAPTPQKTPPAGAGECAAPKLLQYAFAHNLKPIAMAEFWWGNSPKNELRHHRQYYPACKGKCEPILGHMLHGMQLDPDPLHSKQARLEDIEILFEDEYLLVLNKPAGILSVPGKSETPSVYSYIREKYPQATGPLIVHRLDMATSGLLLIAKSKEIHKELQAQFHLRSIKKRYLAVLTGLVSKDHGRIELPLATDYNHRPMQMVDFERGKPAITDWEVLERRNNETLVAFYPLTGRTHQLRMHAAHPQGLHCPIKGDELYSTKADRLYLHAEQLEFLHPVSKELIKIEKDEKF